MSSSLPGLITFSSISPFIFIEGNKDHHALFPDRNRHGAVMINIITLLLAYTGLLLPVSSTQTALLPQALGSQLEDT